MPLDPSVLANDRGDEIIEYRGEGRPPLTRRAAAENVDARLAEAIKGEGAEHLAPIVNALYGQESSYGRNARTSVDGARGPMQIMPGTFKQLARPGESIDNPDDNLRVGIRLIKALGDKFNNDPARIAAAYFSGEGNVNATGEQVVRNDRADGNGKRVSSYVQDVLGRLVPSANASEPGTARQITAGGGGRDADVTQLSIFKDNPGQGATPADEDLALAATPTRKKAEQAEAPMPRREELAVRDMLAGKSPDELARIAGTGGLPGRVAQAILAQGDRPASQPQLGNDFRSFEELASSPGYQELPAPQKDEVRQRWFAEKVAPSLPPDRQQAAWVQFEKKTRPGMTDRIGSAIDKATAPGMLERAAGDAKDIVGRMFGQPDRQEVALRKMLAQHNEEQLQRIASQGGAPAKVARAMINERQADNPVNRFAADKAMAGNKLGKSTPQGIEVLDRDGRLIGHWQ